MRSGLKEIISPRTRPIPAIYMISSVIGEKIRVAITDIVEKLSKLKRQNKYDADTAKTVASDVTRSQRRILITTGRFFFSKAEKANERKTSPRVANADSQREISKAE